MFVRWLPLIAGVVPTIGITIAYWLGHTYGPLPSCIPYIDGCTSISATGRYPPGSFVFRAVEFPQALLLMLVWYFSIRWLRALDPGLARSRERWIFTWGLVGALALIIYVTFLGTKEPIYEFMRRFGIYFYYLGTAISQLLVALSFLRIARQNSQATLRRLANTLLWLVGIPFAIGILNIVLKSVLEDPDPSENRIEWIATLLMQVYFVVLYVAWVKTGFHIKVAADVRH